MVGVGIAKVSVDSKWYKPGVLLTENNVADTRKPYIELTATKRQRKRERVRLNHIK